MDLWNKILPPLYSENDVDVNLRLGIGHESSSATASLLIGRAKFHTAPDGAFLTCQMIVSINISLLSELKPEAYVLLKRTASDRQRLKNLKKNSQRGTHLFDYS